MSKRIVLFMIIALFMAGCNVADKVKDKYMVEDEVRTEDVLAEIKGEPKKEVVKDTTVKPVSKRELKRMAKKQKKEEKRLSGDTLNFFERKFPKKIQRDSIYPQVYKSQPRSILIIYPYNRSKEQYGDRMFLTAMTKELTLKGYYLFPVTAIAQQAKQDTAFNSRYQTAANAKSYYKDYGADVALYITIYSINKPWWSTKTEIVADYTMISTHTEDTLFHRQATFEYSSPFPLKDKSETSLLADNKEFQIFEAVEQMQHYVFLDFPYGPYHPEYLKDKKKFSHQTEMNYKISIIPE
ncbi:MAG: DUF799 domain-containing protein [Bacteroidales bacterium]|jgi:hypothetical protein|nr:DUF799 domain-containing protein [Bacteroidales bacterium]